MNPQLQQTLLQKLPKNPHPLLLARIDDIAALTNLIQQLEHALEQTGVFFPDQNGGGKINPLVEAIGKNRERLRRAMNDLQKLLDAQPAEPVPNPHHEFMASMNGWEAIAYGDTGFPHEYDPDAPGAPVNFGIPFPDPPEYKGPIPKEELLKLRENRPRYKFGPNGTYTLEYPNRKDENDSENKSENDAVQAPPTTPASPP